MAAELFFHTNTDSLFYDQVRVGDIELFDLDPVEQGLLDTAKEAYENGGDRKEIEDWFQREVERYRKEKKEAETITPEVGRTTETVTVTGQRQRSPRRCHVLSLDFKTPANGTKLEMQRQLTLQQTVLNSKNPCKAATDIAKYPVNKVKGEAARPVARDVFIRAEAASLQRLNPSLSHSQAMAQALKAAATKDAIHILDMVAGGNPMAFAGLGERSENRSIGAQWGKGGKAAQLAAYAYDQCKNGCPKMQTVLTAV
ncbi:MAG: hypothetical protein HC869_05315 [Rhodospirillales bacterium]|nr:hypothetical protein [Rhodospirillales bacterium]